ncbi:MAG: SUF system NifU family Fe-S cluster assembly protein [Chloroflexi bacterium]|nr:SUF system NifU family Fe-S cluster assembly protein [Chloroflexota bacterium]
MSDLQELYQQVVLDHSKRPRNFRKLEDANHTAEGYNPLCGDHYHIYLKVEDNTVKDVGFEGAGCAISKASASLMTDSVKGKSRAEIEILFNKFHDMITGKVEPTSAELEKLSVFSGVREFPVRVKCASLAWHTLRAALDAEGKTVTTE